MLRAEIGVDRLVPFVARVPVAALATAADGDGGNAARHRPVGIRTGAGEGDARRAGYDRDRALRGPHDRRIQRHDAGGPVADQFYFDGDLVRIPARVFFLHSIL